MQTRETGSVDRQKTFAYDTLNNISSYKDWIGGTIYETTYAYNKDSRQTKTEGGDLTREWEYDAYGRTDEIVTKSGGTQILKSELVYPTPDSSHTLPQVNGWWNRTTGLNQLLEYGYNSSGNINIVRDNDVDSSTYYEVRYSYDKLARLTIEFNGKNDRKYVYAYDSSGNITSKSEYVLSTGLLLHTYNYTYGDSTWGDLLTSYDGHIITSDAIGNMTNDGTWSYTWEHGRQLASITNLSTSQTISYSYNADGMRLSGISGPRTCKYYYNNGKLVKIDSYISGVRYSSYYIRYDAEGNPISICDWVLGKEYAYMRNLQGDIIGLVDKNDGVVVRYYYDAWGKPIATDIDSGYNDIASGNPLRYRGYIYDTDTGLYYLGQRYYSPELCRYISADNVYSGICSTNGLVENNLFAYCDDNPVLRSDEGGEFWNIVAGAVIGAVVNVATTIIESKFNSEPRALSVSEIIVSAATGAIGGALTSTGLPACGIAATSAVVGAAGSVANDCIKGKTDIKTIGRNAVMNGLIAGVAGYLGGSGIANNYKTLGNFQKSYNSNILTSIRTFGKKVSTYGVRKATKITYKSITYIGKLCWKLAKPKMAETTSKFVGSCLFGALLSDMYSRINK